MCEPTAADFDTCVLVNSDILKNAGLMPSVWGLPAGEPARICKAGIGLVPATWPGFKWTPSGHNHIKHLVVFDTLYLRTEAIGCHEFRAFLLHEIGHVINPPKDSYMAKSCVHEYYADDYVRHCGFSEDLTNCLEVLRRLDPISFDSDLTMQRIRRIRDNEPLLLNLSPISQPL